MSRQDEIHEGEDAMNREIIKAIVFLAMYCEAYIWDLAASVLGDNYTHKYLDKLDTFSKWVIIPEHYFVPLVEQIDLDGMFKQISELFHELQKLDPAGIHRL